MEEFSYKVKVAVIKLLGELLNADKIVHEKEVKYLDEDFKEHKQKFSGFIAQNIQHQCDHLNGKII